MLVSVWMQIHLDVTSSSCRCDINIWAAGLGYQPGAVRDGVRTIAMGSRAPVLVLCVAGLGCSTTLVSRYYSCQWEKARNVRSHSPPIEKKFDDC